MTLGGSREHASDNVVALVLGNCRSCDGSQGGWYQRGSKKFAKRMKVFGYMHDGYCRFIEL